VQHLQEGKRGDPLRGPALPAQVLLLLFALPHRERGGVQVPCVRGGGAVHAAVAAQLTSEFQIGWFGTGKWEGWCSQCGGATHLILLLDWIA